ncbi:MAG: hypothetical protein AABY92_04900, partial [Thermodesulfobacteriota bacterium]
LKSRISFSSSSLIGSIAPPSYQSPGDIRQASPLSSLRYLHPLPVAAMASLPRKQQTPPSGIFPGGAAAKEAVSSPVP